MTETWARYLTTYGDNHEARKGMKNAALFVGGWEGHKPQKSRLKVCWKMSTPPECIVDWPPLLLSLLRAQSLQG